MTTNNAADGQLHPAGDIRDAIARKQKDLPDEAVRQRRVGEDDLKHPKEGASTPKLPLELFDATRLPSEPDKVAGTALKARGNGSIGKTPWSRRSWCC